MTINMKIASDYKHKRCKMRTTNIKFTMTRKITNSSNQWEEKEDNDQHEDRDQEGHELL